MSDEIRAAIVIEMMGRPASHLADAMKELLKRISSEEGVKIESKKTHKPKILEQKDKEGNVIKVEGGKEMYSSFAEITLEVKHLMHLIRIVFVYMPAHIEILSPPDMSLQNFDISTILNEITKKMHGYDAIAKNAIMQNNMLVAKIRQMQAYMQEMQKGGTKKAVKKSSKKKSSKKKK